MPPLRKVIFVSLAFVVLGLFATPSIKADTVVIGGTNSANCYPFGNCGYTGPHQQFYSSSQFSGPVAITQISFASGGPNTGSGGAATYNFSLGLSNTSATPSSFSATYAANRGANFTTVFNGPFTAMLQANNTGQTFDFNIILTTPFLYDPSQGNLLVEVNMVSSSGPQNFFRAGDSPLTGRNFNNPPNNTTTGLGTSGFTY